MGTKTVKKALIPFPMDRVASWAPKGWAFSRAMMANTEEFGEGVRVWFAKTPVPPPIIHPKDSSANFIANLGKGHGEGEPYTSEHVLGGDVRLTFADGHEVMVPKMIADNMFEYRPSRRPTLRLLTLDGIKNLEMPMMQAIVANTIHTVDELVVDVLLSDKQVREFLSLGEDVAIRGVRGIWEGEAVVGRGRCTGFSVRCVEAV